MSRRRLVGLALCATLNVLCAQANAACTKFSLLQSSGVTNGPLYLQWPCGTSIALGCVNCPTGWDTVVEGAKSSWASENTGYSFQAGVGVIWITTNNWPPNLGDENLEAAAAQMEQDANGFINGGGIWINNYNYGFSISMDAEPGYYDYESVMIHEIGHFLGLDDADCYSVMSDLTAAELQRYPLDLDSDAIDYLYCCDQQFLESGEISQTTSTCGDPGNSAVETSRLLVRPGEVSWKVFDERGTQEFLVEGLHDREGPGVVLAREQGGIGNHVVQLGVHEFPYLRLVEVERGGRRLICDVTSARPEALVDATGRQESGEYEPLVPAKQRRETLPSGESVIIYTHDSLLTPLLPLVDYWAGLGYQVSLRWYQHHFSDELTLAEDIALAAQNGTKYFHIVGGWSDYFAVSDLWDASPYWQTKRQNYTVSGRLQNAPDTGVSIPPTINADATLGPFNTARSRPYVFSDQGYGDIDGDGTPDVVVTRWPATTVAQVQTLVSKVTSYGSALAAGTRRPDRTTLFVGDLDYQDVDPDETVALGSLVVEALHDVAPAQSTATYLRSDHLGSNIADTAAHLNSWNPDLVVMLSTYSSCMGPADFFNKYTSPAWSMGLLNSGTQAALIASASCDAADYTTPCYEFAQPICNDFLFTANKGALAWLGPTTGSWQTANYAVERFLVEEMFQNPYRPMAESWLTAMQRAYDAFGTQSDYTPTLNSYVFLGDPLSPFARLPETDTDGFVNDKQHMMPQHVAVGCPQGDRDDLIVEVRLDAIDVLSPIPQSGLTLTPPSGILSEFFPELASIPADSAPALRPPGEGFSNGYYRTTFTVSAFGGCETRSAPVNLYGLPLTSVSTKLRSPDLNANGSVNVSDFAIFGINYPLDPAPDDCRDFNNDGKVNTVDFATFGAHNNHQAPAQAALGAATESTAGVTLRFTEEFPTALTHRLYVDVDVENFADVEVSLFAVIAGNDRLEFQEWLPANNSLGTVIFAPVSVEAEQQLYFGTLTSEEFSGSESTLGRLVFNVAGTDLLEISASDFVMTVGDVLLDANGETVVTARMAGVLGRRIDPQMTRVYHDRLEPNFPNPFNPTTTLAFSIAHANDVKLTVYDVAGRRVRDLVNERKERGTYKVVWDGQNDAGETVASGVYFYKLVAGSFTDTKKMTFLK